MPLSSPKRLSWNLRLMIILQWALATWRANKGDAVAIGGTIIAFILWSGFTLYLAISSQSTLEKHWGPGIDKVNLIIGAMPVLVSVLLYASIRTVTNVSHTYDIARSLAQPSVHVKRHDDTDEILRFLDRFKYGRATATIFLGFADSRLIKGLVDFFEAESGKAHFHLYVHPGTLGKFLDAGLFYLNESTTPTSNLPSTPAQGNAESAPQQQQIYVVDCPRESCVVFARETTVLYCLTARYLPSEGGACWTAEIQKDSQFAINLEDTFNQYYQSKAVAVPLPLHAVSKARFLQKTHDDGRNKIKTFIDNTTRHFASRERGYQFATHLLMHARQSVCAVDFMLPKRWLDLHDYEDAHLILKEKKVPVERIHIYKRENLITDRESYNEYVERQNKLGVALHFLSATQAKGLLRAGSTGFALIDRQVVYAVEEDADKKECARIDFGDTVKVYTLTFDALKAMNPTLVDKEKDIDKIARAI